LETRDWLEKETGTRNTQKVIIRRYRNRGKSIEIDKEASIEIGE
jgi:hypothetical protein